MFGLGLYQSSQDGGIWIIDYNYGISRCLICW